MKLTTTTSTVDSNCTLARPPPHDGRKAPEEPNTVRTVYGLKSATPQLPAQLDRKGKGMAGVIGGNDVHSRFRQSVGIGQNGRHT